MRRAARSALSRHQGRRGADELVVDQVAAAHGAAEDAVHQRDAGRRGAGDAAGGWAGQVVDGPAVGAVRGGDEGVGEGELRVVAGKRSIYGRLVGAANQKYRGFIDGPR